MTEYYGHYHRWEALAEFHFYIDENEEMYDDNYIYCLCSRAFIRDGIKTYYSEKECGSESDGEVIESQVDEQSHVHFSVDTSYKVKCDKDEVASCYCSASHTENYCSTDELDPSHTHNFPSHPLQPSDSGADLTYQDCNSDYITHDKVEKMDQDYLKDDSDSNENYLSEDTWEKFWALNGERIIWASWIKKYSDYINPTYLDENNDLIMDENSLPKQRSVEPICTNIENIEVEDERRERKLSYDSKINPYKNKSDPIEDKNDKNNQTGTKEDAWLPVRRRRSLSEHDRIVSPWTLTGTDSMTNVTKLTLSSYNVTSSHVTSESSPTGEYSMSSSASSDDQFNDQTRIQNIEDHNDDPVSEELDTDDYWQFLWKKHFGEQYALHYAKYIECYDKHKVLEMNTNELETIVKETKVIDVECENSEGNSQEMPSVIEVQTQIDQIKLDDKVSKPKKRGKRTSNRVISSVGVLLQNLLKEQKDKEFEEPIEAGDEKTKSGDSVEVNIERKSESSNIKQINQTIIQHNDDDGEGNDPYHDRPVTLKRSHQIDEEETSEKIKATIDMMGFSLDVAKVPKGELIYRNRFVKLRPPRYKRFGNARKTYFDDDGNTYNLDKDQSQESQDECEIQTDEDGPEIQLNIEKVNKSIKIKEKSKKSMKKSKERKQSHSECDAEGSLDLSETNNDVRIENPGSSNQTKRKRRQKRFSKNEEAPSDLPDELKGEPKMFKYWKKRHSLFHRFDEGIQLDRESWFSVTPETVARHIAAKCRYDVVVDAFCGAGGNTIQFATTSKKVIAIDIDPVKIEMAKHNASVYGVSDRIQFIVGDFFEIAPTLTADMVFLSPPWGGPNYSQNHEYDIETMLEPKPATELMRVARNINSNVTLYLPRNTRTEQILSLAQEAGGSVEIEQSFLDRRFIAITAYFY